MARRKIVLVIVEGASDETALGAILSQFYDKDTVYVHIMHGDITTRKGVTSQNIVARLGKEITAYARSRHYTAQNFKQIIHIIDTDAAYIPDSKIEEDQLCEKVVYKDEGIYTADTKGIIARNMQKRDNIFRLRSCGRIWNIPYRIYYMSCNLDHVLYDKCNSTDEEKEKNAYAFAKKYKMDVEGFLHFICESEFSINGEFKDSWEYIEKDMNSIKRYTNFSICMKEELTLQQIQKEEEP